MDDRINTTENIDFSNKLLHNTIDFKNIIR